MCSCCSLHHWGRDDIVVSERFTDISDSVTMAFTMKLSVLLTLSSVDLFSYCIIIWTFWTQQQYRPAVCVRVRYFVYMVDCHHQFRHLIRYVPSTGNRKCHMMVQCVTCSGLILKVSHLVTVWVNVGHILFIYFDVWICVWRSCVSVNRMLFKNILAWRHVLENVTLSSVRKVWPSAVSSHYLHTLLTPGRYGSLVCTVVTAKAK